MREQARTDKSKQNMAPFLVRVLQGALIGVGAILPGVSGGVLSVVFGVYQPMMALLAHPVTGPVESSLEQIFCWHRKSPLDEELVVKTAKKTGRVFTVEEHSIIGGLGAAGAETLGEKCPTKITRIGVNDVFGESGPAKELLHKYGLDAEGIANRILREMK